MFTFFLGNSLLPQIKLKLLSELRNIFLAYCNMLIINSEVGWYRVKVHIRYKLTLISFVYLSNNSQYEKVY